MTIDEYEAMRRSPERFVIYPGHDVPDAEEIVDETEEGAVIVEKDSDLSPITRALDPRRS